MADHQTPLDASNVFPRIWIGGYPPIDRRLSFFSMVVLCAREYQPDRVSWDGIVVRARLDDVPMIDRADLRDAVGAARLVVDEVRRGGKVLVTCAAGRNRSALVAGMAMLQLSPRMPAEDVMAEIRSRRHPHCLSNPSFVAMLRRIRSPESVPPPYAQTK